MTYSIGSIVIYQGEPAIVVGLGDADTHAVIQLTGTQKCIQRHGIPYDQLGEPETPQAPEPAKPAPKTRKTIKSRLTKIVK